MIKHYHYAINFAEKKLLQTFSLLFFAALQIIALRGGTQLAPINQSTVYFSNNNFANQAALNAVWNFMSSIYRKENDKNPFVYVDEGIAGKLKDSLLMNGNTVYHIVDSAAHPAPNIIIVIWESLTQKATNLTKEGREITPKFNQLKKEGIYFPNIYATGDRTDKGIVGILSGYPSQPTNSIIKIPKKADKLPTLAKVFSKNGYSTAFYYGGELEFANIKSYLLTSGYDELTGKNEFEEGDYNSKWGAHDHIVKDRIVLSLKNKNQPFFATWLTLSSHEPYEVPTEGVIEGRDDVSRFLNSVHYSDSVVYQFVQECKQQSWWNNTIMIIVADHGHRLPPTGNRIDDFKIPMLWLGGALSKNGVEMPRIGSQVDLANSLLGQVQKSDTAFNWSRNLFSDSPHAWAYFSFNNGFGYVENEGYFIFDNVGKRLRERKGTITENILTRGKAIQQETFEDFLKK